MAWINVGASINGTRVPNKKRLREALAADLKSVEFDQTSTLGHPDFPASFTVDILPDRIKLTVVLPDPYTDRRYYATVEKKNGKVKVS